MICSICLLIFLATSQGWIFPSPKKALAAKAICRKSFLVGAAGAAVLGTTATVASAAVSANKKEPYEPATGSMMDKVVLITGGTTGLGLESAKRLAAAGATVVVTSRNAAKGEGAVANVNDYVRSKGIDGSSKVYSLVLNLDDLDNVKAFPKSFEQLGLKKIDVLMNNAGVMAIPDLQLTKDGYERTFQSNHLGHFALTTGLFPFLNREKATVINVSSEAYQIANGGLALDNLNGEKQYGPWTSYGLSKLANILFTQELQRRADAVGDSWLTCVSLHPGAVATDLGRYLVGEHKWNDLKTKGPSGFENFALNAASLFTKTVPEGASTQVFLAAGGEGTVRKGAFYEDLKPKKLPSFATDQSKAEALWERSEQLVGVKFELSSSES